MKRVSVCHLVMAMVMGVAMTGAATAQTSSQPDPVKAKSHKVKKSRHVTRKKSARARKTEEARLKAEVQAKRDAEIAAREKLINDGQALMNAGKPAEAYALLAPVEFEYAGDKRFDYLLGIAALDSGKPDKATLAFERVLAVDPNFAGARLDMARAYYRLGDLPRARTEFQTVMQQNPPPAAKATIQKYLDVIAAQGEAKKTRITGYVEATAGHDTNVNSSTSQAIIPVPVFNNIPFTLSQANLQKTDDYEGLAAGGAIKHLINPHTGLYAGIDVRQRGNMTQTQFDSIDISGNAGVSYTTGAENFRAGLLGDQYTLANARNRDTVGVNGVWRHVFSPSNQLSLFGQFSQSRFADPALQVQDFNQAIVGAGWMHVMSDGKSAVFGSLFYGRENDVAPATATNPTGGRPDGNKEMTGLRIGGQMALNEEWNCFASAGVQQGRYDKQNAAFLTKRNDTQDDMTFGLNWRITKLWTLRPQVAWSRNDSNIAIYSYKRTDASITIRRNFM